MDSVRKFLAQLGWSPDVVEAYIRLVEHGPVKASELRDHMDKDPGKAIYNIIKELRKRGGIGKADGHKKGDAGKVEAMHPRALFTSMMDELDALRADGLQEVEQMYEARREGSPPLLPDKAVIGHVGIQAAILEALLEAKERILVHDSRLAWLSNKVIEVMAGKKGCKVQVIADGIKSTKKLQLQSKGIDVHNMDPITPTFIIADDTVVVVQYGSHSATVSKNAALADLLAAQFDTSFKAAGKEMKK